MKKIYFYTFLLLVLFTIIYPQSASAGDEIHVLYDSETKNPELKPGWGFSALVKRGDLKILLDAGWREDVFKHNLQKSGYRPQDIDFLVISHWHPDHYGGLRYLLSQNPSIQVYVPADFSGNYPANWKIQTVKEHIKLSDEVYVFQTKPNSARFGIEEELTLVVKTKQGPVIVSGCFHTGWPELLKKVKEVIPAQAYLMLGGGRFVDKSESELHKLAQEVKGLGLQNVGLTHCAAGEIPNKVFEQYYKGHSVYSRLGAVIPLPE